MVSLVGRDGIRLEHALLASLEIEMLTVQSMLTRDKLHIIQAVRFESIIPCMRYNSRRKRNKRNKRGFEITRPESSWNKNHHV